MERFDMNGLTWEVAAVEPGSIELVDRTGALTLATTDPSEMTVYISSALHGTMLYRVLVHELAHCAIYSYGLLDDIHRMCLPAYWVDAEEWICNFIADYGWRIFDSAYKVLGSGALRVVPREIERLVA